MSWLRLIPPLIASHIHLGHKECVKHLLMMSRGIWVHPYSVTLTRLGQIVIYGNRSLLSEKDAMCHDVMSWLRLYTTFDCFSHPYWTHLKALSLWSQICNHFFIELRASLITFPNFVHWQSLIARSLTELSSSNPGISHIYTKLVASMSWVEAPFCGEQLNTWVHSGGNKKLPFERWLAKHKHTNIPTMMEPFPPPAPSFWWRNIPHPQEPLCKGLDEASAEGFYQNK
jgi:hypothetical protein